MKIITLSCSVNVYAEVFRDIRPLIYFNIGVIPRRTLIASKHLGGQFRLYEPPSKRLTTGREMLKLHFKADCSRILSSKLEAERLMV